ncbi:MAG: hypothetical protein ABIK37_01605 [candidate division WOR-3 bacterium]
MRAVHMAALASFVAVAIAGVWTSDGFTDLPGQLERAELRGVSVLPSGRVVIAPALTRVCSLDESAIWRAAIGTGELYIATGPNARVFRVGANGRSQAVYDGGSGEILAIAADSRGAIWFGSTPGGLVYRISEGRPALVCSTGCAYLLCLLPSPDGSLLCGTGNKGQLLRILPTGKCEVVFSAAQAHISTLTWLIPGKELLVGTSPGGLVYRLSFHQSHSQPGVSVLYDTPLDEVRAIVGDDDLVYIAGNPAEDEAAESAAVFAVDTTGVCHWQWRCPDSSIFDLVADGRLVLVATGNRGLLYGLDRHGRATLVRQLQEPQALCFATSREGILVGTGTPARLYRLGPGRADSGHVAPPPFDCTNPARFGRFENRTSIPAGTEVSFEFRSGNSSLPDSTWSPWMAASDRVAAPPARFLQWRARLSTGFPNLSPELERVDVWFEPANTAPVVLSISVAGASWGEASQGLAKPRREVTWSASDSESDSLTYDLYLRSESDSRWVRIGDRLAEMRFELDTRALPDGWFELRVVASDRPTRSEQAALKGELTSSAFVVDNTPPRVLNLQVRNGQASFTVTDELSVIRACRVSVNAGEWTPAIPQDGMFDSREERFTVPVRLEPGPNTVAVWVSDAQGNVGAGRISLR